jgi:Leucine-rich repeat (LRR) protein
MEFECDPEEDIGEISLSYLDVAMYCANLTRLEGAWLIDDEVLCKLAQGCPLLEELSSLGKGRSDQAVSALAKHCSKLQRLSLTSTATEDSMIALVRNNPGLHDLYLSGGDITNRFVRELSLSCSRLKELSLSHAELDIYTVYFLLGQCKCLTSLTFEHLDIGRDEETPAPGPLAPTGLLSLTFEDAGITDTGLNVLLNACPALTSLLLSGCEALLHLHAIPLGAMCPALEDLSLYDNGSAAGDLTLWQLAQHCPGLSALRVPGSPLVSDIGARAVFENCPLLEELDLDESQITDASLVALGQNGRHVNTLYLRDCTEVTNVGIEAVMEGCTKLTEFGVEGCTKLTARLVRAIHKRYDALGRD